jgi:membrane protease YdiL (CAAX protease family)
VTTFQLLSLLLIAVWLLMVLLRFHHVNQFLIGGMFAIAVFTLVAYLSGEVTFKELGLNRPGSWLFTTGIALGWLLLMLAYSPLADWLASRWIKEPPTLQAFRIIQQSRGKLLAGIAAAWFLGGFLEELIFRGMLLNIFVSLLSNRLVFLLAVGVAICVAALGAGIVHIYQGPRAVAIIIQLSVLFGILFVISGYNLWSVIVCHGLYDTIAFVRFASGKSKYSKSNSQ